MRWKLVQAVKGISSVKLLSRVKKKGFRLQFYRQMKQRLLLISGDCWYTELYKHMTKEIRFQCWLGAGVYFGRPLFTVKTEFGVFEFEVSAWSLVLSMCINRIIIRCFSLCVFPPCNYIFGAVGSVSPCYLLIKFIICQSKECCYAWASSCLCFAEKRGLIIFLWSLNLFSENELPQQAGGVSSPSQAPVWNCEVNTEHFGNMTRGKTTAPLYGLSVWA